METEKLVGQTIVCECGKTHRIDPREVLYAEDAIARMPELCAKYAARRGGAGVSGAARRVAVLFDARTRAAAGPIISYRLFYSAVRKPGDKRWE